MIYLALLLAASLFLGLNACGGSQAAPSYSGSVRHVVIIFQENRTPDNLFQDPVLISRGADIVSSGQNSKGETIPLTPTHLGGGYDLDHTHSSFEAMYDGGKMDGADLIPVDCPPDEKSCPPSNAQFTYVNQDEVQPYFLLAEQYTFADRMFQTNQGPSFPAHQFIISGTSAPTATSPLFAAENPVSGAPVVGCIGPSTETVAMIDPSGNESSVQYPCFEHPTITDLLDTARISWRYYANSSISVWTGPAAIQHICQPEVRNGQRSCAGAEWNNVVIPQTQILVDIANRQLPAVSWVTPDGHESDHATANDGSGPSWVASVVNAIGHSQYWADTAIFITWDDWGGWYDHVAPKVINSYEYGFRVPLIIVSPYARAGYLSHAPHDFGSILRFVEKTYGLASLGYADARADDLSDCFNFSQTPTAFQTIPAPLDASHFLNDKRPRLDPDDD